MTQTADRLTRWQSLGDGCVQFWYTIDHLTLLIINVRQETMRDVLRDIGRLAADRSSPMTWDDAAYLTKLIRDVMDMQDNADGECGCRQCVVGNRAEIAWSVLMFVCSAAIMATLAVFLLWGL